MSQSQTPENTAPQSSTPVEHSQAAAAGKLSAASADPGEASDAINGSEPDKPIAVVGLGASAGGIRVLQTILGGIPTDSGLAFVVVMHLSPDHDSNLAEVLQYVSTIPVQQVTDRVSVEPNCVYVIPPDKYIAIEDSHLYLTNRNEPLGKRVAIDLFFRTLAAVYGQRAVCAVLSGTDSDGVIGLKHIREQGGVTVVQDPEEAEYDSMPRSAIETGMVDWILPAAEIAPRLVEFARNEQRMHLPPEDAPDGHSASTRVLDESEKPGGAMTARQIPNQNDESAIHDVLVLLRNQTGHDFMHYKRATVLRRIARRMQVNMLEDVTSYLDFLREHHSEAQALLYDLLINVTNFFRDPEAFAALESHIPQLFAGKGASEAVRVWVCGCATGEEAYSVAMLLAEHAARLESPPPVQVFATDLDDSVIHVARTGLYPLTIEADVSPERLRRFFTIDQGRYRVRQEIRDMVLFARHNVLKDSPFSRLDLISCRNMLIYLKREAQERVFETFHFSLHSGGLMFLGTSESVSDAHTLFAPLDKTNRLYVRRAMSRPSWQIPIQLPSPTPMLPPVSQQALSHASTHPILSAAPAIPSFATTIPPVTPRETERQTVLFGDLHLRLLEEYAPPSVVVNENYDIVHLSRQAGRFFQMAGGEPSVNLLKVVHPELRIELRTALFRAMQSGKPISTSIMPIELEASTRLVSIHVRPVLEAVGQGVVLVVFDDLTDSKEAPETTSSAEPVSRQLEVELQQLKEQLTTTVEQYEASVEELKASNEELQAMNEELRSATEELQTSKEELQSVNEELTTVNHELKSNLDELARSNNDLQNLLTSTEIGTIFLDRQLCIKRFTPRVHELFNIIPTDLGRPLSDLTNKLSQDDFTTEAARVLRDLVTAEHEVQSHNGQWFMARMLPYRTLDDRIDGVVVTFVNITARKQAEESLRKSEERFRTVSDAVPQIIWTNDSEGRANYFNYRWFEYSGLSYEESAGLGWQAIVHPDDYAGSVELWLHALSVGEVFEVEYRLKRGDGVYRWHIGRNVPLLASNGQVLGWFGTATHIEDMKQAEQELRESEERYRLLVEGTKDHAMFLMDAERRIIHWNYGAERVFGFTREEAMGQSGDMIFTPEDRAIGAPEQEALIAITEGRAMDVRWHQRKDGSLFWADGVNTSLKDEAGNLRGFAKITRDATREKQIEDELQAAHDELEKRVLKRTKELRREIQQRKEAEQARELLLQRIVNLQEEERSRISRELHDQMGQQLTALIVGLKSLSKLVDAEGQPASSSQQVEYLQNIGEELMQQTHQLAWELRPSVLDTFGLEPTLRQHVEEWMGQSGINADFITRGIRKNMRISPEIETALYRVVQEALTNVQRHSEATQVSVVLERRDKNLIVIVEDNGKGFDVGHTAPGKKQRLGVIGMRERLSLVGGSLDIESTASGTTVYARVPIK